MLFLDAAMTVEYSPGECGEIIFIEVERLKSARFTPLVIIRQSLLNSMSLRKALVIHSFNKVETLLVQIYQWKF
jgi:hypothetical protein